MSPRPALSLVVLCYRTGPFARTFARRAIDAIEAAGLEDYEIVLVGNYVEGSGDTTPDVVRAVADELPRVRCVAVAKQGWMGWDMRSGLEHARGEHLAVIDGDGQVPVRAVPRLFALLREGGHDLVMTYRTSRGDSLWRRLVSAVYNVAFRALFPGLGVRDVNAKPKIMTRAAYERLTLESDDWFIDAEIVIQARRLDLSIAELPEDFRSLDRRRSFVTLGAIVTFAFQLVRARVRESVRR